MPKGRVIQSTGKWYSVDLEGSGVTECRLPGRFRLNDYERTNPIAVGDWVDVDMVEDGTGQITDIHERKNAITRQATHGRRGSQILAANVDMAISVQSLVQPEFKPGFADRFLVSCEAFEITPLLVVNKVDLAGKGALSYLDDMMAMYTEIGYDVQPCSIHRPDLLEALKDRLKGNTSVFVGPSGTGKSSLLNAVDPQAGQHIGEISSWSNKGTHTTTYARLVPLGIGGSLVDTPGIREFGLYDIEAAEVGLCFPDFEPWRDECRYHNCLHVDEPGCAVAQAFDEGKIHPSRYRSYLNIVDSLSNSSQK